MPYVERDGTNIYWNEQGEGEPLLLIMGLGWASGMWYRILPTLSLQYRTIVLDNRGIGLSDAPPGPYSIKEMANDAAAVLDAARLESAHVCGFSMGGMIAQELALEHPARVRSLILGGTSCGGQRSVRPAPEVIEVLGAKGYTNHTDAFWGIVPYIYDPSTPLLKIEEDFEARRVAFPTRASYESQLQAILRWESYDRLSAINVPTLVMHGETDQLIPVENGRILAMKIPGAKLLTLAHSSHNMQTDRTLETVGAILSFLKDVN